ncbi:MULTISPECIES: amidohydrolase/deacetylase family metallohydrolase [Dyadobacter]|uniref:Amidohydrolase/deacetylase family metallohydrolase n=1 Tax=Dyadobacter chenhuakuii TaxID=2909339 RepID=A0ABY4XN32_9BACT|nr:MULTISPECIES: amidohydrolase/deacetylase family metallohydrolase [Dyadobacter]MCF2494931.1 amidohydrolase/deacetylase family metallohydrolase [Dyadobacter chenhuakuii]MCF2518989.1 amidohydrolase/deacetylase family metallohydrolase [Dyadobacter sp. CY351]USJ31752.1 amidohydrolase/deacetylase family metallohydrolase [Dyadobacter chenhuakuii]
MKHRSLLILFLICSVTLAVNAQTYSILIKGGTVIDPKNNLNQIMDVGIFEGKIKKVARDIDPKEARQVVDAKGMYVTPGLIDIHGHVFFGTQPDHYLSNGLVALPPDGFTFRVGVTTIVDAGGAGWDSFSEFKKNVIFNSKTRVLSFLNIVGEGMRGGNWEQDTSDMNPELAAGVALKNKNDVVGFKVAHFMGNDWKPVDNAVKAGKLSNMPVMIDFGGSTPPLPLEELFLKHLRPGDIFTHAYTLLEGNVRETIVDEKARKVRPFVLEARKRGIIFDVGYGGASFNYSQAIPAIKQGFFPNTISTDLHTGSMNGSMKDMLSIMSKFYVMGMDLPSVIKASTWEPAQVIKRENLGHISENAIADVAIFSMRKGNFGFYDKTGYKMEGKEKLECEMTIMGGKIVYDLNGIAKPIYLK